MTGLAGVLATWSGHRETYSSGQPICATADPLIFVALGSVAVAARR